MEDKKLLTNEELEKVAGGSDTLDGNVRNAFHSAEAELENIKNRVYAYFRSNVEQMIDCCIKVLHGILSVDTALDRMQTCCNQINIDDRRAPQDILDQLRSSLGR